MTTPPEAVMRVITGQRGERPVSLQDGEAEKILGIALALLVEVTAANDRIDRLEREVADLRGTDLTGWKSGEESDDATRARADEAEALQLRVLRPLLDPRNSR